MFTGIVEGTSPCTGVRLGEAGSELVLDLGSLAADVGDSVSVNGCCLTVSSLAGSRCSFDVVPETLSKTTLGSLSEGRMVNVERALRLGDRLGGHLVTGHVDARAEILALSDQGEERDLEISVPEELRSHVVAQGSVAIDGVSLTVASLTARGLRVALVPHTLGVTTLGGLGVGDHANLETDILAKWVERLISAGRVEGFRSLEDFAREWQGLTGSQ